MPNHSEIGFGGGCHWCTEAVFQALKGVSNVQQGFIASTPPNDSFSEAVIVNFDPITLPLDVLVEVHLRTHASTSPHKMRGKYRSAIYVMSQDHHVQAADILQTFAPDFDAPLVTQVLPYKTFKLSNVRFQNYYQTDPEKPFCTRYIDPKLDLLRTCFASHTQI